MNINNDLKKDGITVIEPVDALSATLINKFVADKLASAFPFYSLKYNDLFIKLSRIPMYIADIPNGMSEASYLFKNSTIYFKKGLDIEDMKKFAVHEFIHHLQEQKDSNNVLYRLGLCDCTNIRIQGMALNEGAVQLMTSRVLKSQVDTVKYYDIDFSTISPTYYPLICNLVQQMAYVTGNEVLFDSTLHSNDKFKNTFSALCGNRAFYKIQKNLDKILKAEENLIISSSRFEENTNISKKGVARISTQVGKCKQIIQNTFLETQNLIISSYFDNLLDNVYSVENIESLRKKLYNYKDLLGVTADYSYFNNYYINMMSKLDEKYTAITGNAYPVEYKRSVFKVIFDSLSKLLRNPSANENFNIN